MPSGIAAAVREALAIENVADDELVKLVTTPWGKTGYVGVIDINGRRS